MSYSNITVQRDERLFIVTINRPDVMNALNPDTHAEMDRAFNEFENDPELWVAIVTGAGDAAFCAGGDQKIRGTAGYRDAEGTEHLNVLDFQREIRIASCKGFQ